MKKQKLRTGIAVLVAALALAACGTTPGGGGSPLDIDLSTGVTLNVTVDDAALRVTRYKAVYVSKPIAVKDGGAEANDFQSMYIYVPEHAAQDSAIILYVNNSGWQGWKAAERVKDGDNLRSDENNAAAAALKAGYVFVSAGGRGRQALGPAGAVPMQDMNGDYAGHSPAAVADAKAAVRYLRHNDKALPGSAERIFITGTSGGGGLSAAVGASGNSPDYYPYLYEIGAAGMTSANTSTIKDNVFGVIAYCPITDLDHADQAYEWQYGDLRKDYAVTTDVKGISDGGTAGAAMLAASADLAADYVSYFNSLGLKLEDGSALTADRLHGAVAALVKQEVEYALKNVGVEKMFASGTANIFVPVFNLQTSRTMIVERDNTWIKNINPQNGTADIDYDAFRLFVAQNRSLKIAPAFDNAATPLEGPQNETNLFGAKDQQYANFEFWSWNNNNATNDGIGKDDTGLAWNDFLASENGKALAQQIKMSNPIPYLRSAAEGDSAPYWYIRYGLVDRDTSFAIETELYYAVKNAAGVKDVNFKIAWLQPHSGDYDIPEAYAWAAQVMKEVK
ncbi:MAG: alpha/beta hydrolase fold domain-containing protein [Peptococcaceae bacterium]|jgi:hypothetical protein|nr:alpha/beta hydrolase fold domain-containing protein [Peptococcaceae bacterium]